MSRADEFLQTTDKVFITVGRLGYAYNQSKGWKPYRESSRAITFPYDGRWSKVFWRFYWQTDKTGYSEQ